MNQKAFQAVLVVAMVAFLSVFFFAGADNSLAATGKKKSAAVARTTAVEHAEAQIKQLQDELNFTEAQKGLWDNLTQVMRENAKEMDALTKERTESTKTMNAVEHLKFHSKITEVHLNQQKKLIPPFEALYASMSDEQKKITDTVFETGKHGKHKNK